MWLGQIKLKKAPSLQIISLGEGTEGVPGGQHDGLHLPGAEYGWRHHALVHHHLEHEFLEPVGGHHQEALLAPVLAPGVLHPPPDHAPGLLGLVTPGEHHGVGHQAVPVHQAAGLVHPCLDLHTKHQLVVVGGKVEKSLLSNIPTRALIIC